MKIPKFSKMGFFKTGMLSRINECGGYGGWSRGNFAEAVVIIYESHCGRIFFFKIGVYEQSYHELFFFFKSFVFMEMEMKIYKK